MASAIPTPRSIYAGKLREYPEFAFSETAVFDRCGRWNEFFRQRIGPSFDGRIVLEIGCADAAYLSGLAPKHPRTAFIGLDWKCKAVYDGARRVAELGLQNVALLRARGQDIRRIFAQNEVDEIWVFHPDPCDKPAELKNRLIGEPFMDHVHHILDDGDSVLALKTDHPGYYQWVLALFSLAEPEWFHAPDERSSRAQTPRTRTRDLVRRSDLPPPSRAIRRQFTVTVNSADYWHDPVAQQRTSQRIFTAEPTLFERRFIRKRLPIYYMEMRKQ